MKNRFVPWLWLALAFCIAAPSSAMSTARLTTSVRPPCASRGPIEKPAHVSSSQR